MRLFKAGGLQGGATLLFAATSAFLLQGWISPAIAATVSGGVHNFSVDRDYATSSITQPLFGGTPVQVLSFEQFDPDFGILNSVNLSFNSNVNGNFNILGAVNAFIVGGNLGDTASVSLTSGLTLRRGGADLTTGTVTVSMVCNAPNRDCTASNTTRNAMSGGFPANPLLLTSPSDTAPFAGPGTIDLVAMIFQFDPAISGPIGGEAFWGAGASISWSGSIGVSYNYTPTNVDVPEPASVVVLTTVLSLGSWIRGRRRDRCIQSPVVDRMLPKLSHPPTD